MATLDTELQDGADQAALAAATQLDGNTNTIARATAAAQSLLANKTFFANDNGGSAIAVQNIYFYATPTDAENDTNRVTTDKSALYVRVILAGRKALFALTPIVSAFDSGDITGQAVAGLKSQICKRPPLMMCNPDETGSNLLFDVAKYIGKGLWLVANGGGGQWAPGNFGYLKNTGGSDPTTTPYLRKLLGWDTIPGDCVDSKVANTKPGLNSTVTNALNTRFDIFDNGGGGDFSCPVGGTCSPSLNNVKDVVRPATGASCTYTNGGNGWHLPVDAKNKPSYYGSASFPDVNRGPTKEPTDPAMGLPRDECHVTAPNGVKANQLGVDNNNCPGLRVGNGTWDRNAYFKVNYGWDLSTWQAQTGLGSNATRYQVYAWELANSANKQRTVGSAVSYYGPQCGASIPSPDRRVLTVAVVNCMADFVQGSTPNVPIQNWVDVFLVEPSLTRERTTQKDVYVEVIRETKVTSTNDTGAFAVRAVPYLIQ